MNVFTDFAERQAPAPVKARQRAVEKRRAKAAERALRERDDLLRIWKRWRRERDDAWLAGPYGAAAQALLEFLRAMSLDDEAALVQFVRATGWQHADVDTKFEVLSLINTTLVALRERAGLPPIDDALPDEEPTAFLIIREMFR